MSTSTEATAQAQAPADTVLSTAQDAEAQSQLTRVVIIALDHSDHSKQAFDWTLKNFLRKESDQVKFEIFLHFLFIYLFMLFINTFKLFIGCVSQRSTYSINSWSL